MICGFWHVSFTHSNLAEAVKWYTEVLGLEFVRDQVQDNDYTRQLVGMPEARLKVAQLRVPGQAIPVGQHHIELVEYAHPRGEPVPLDTNRPGIAHWAFIVDDIHAEFARLRALGVQFKSAAPNLITEGVNKGGHAIYFYGPDGVTLELMQPPE